MSDPEKPSLPRLDMESQADEAATLAPRTTRPKSTGQLPAPGTIVGDFEILSEIARGGMGVVFKAKQCSLNRSVAIKMMLGDATEEPDHFQRFTIEAEAAAALDHPGIVSVYDVGKYDGIPFYAMAYIEGESLAKQLSDGPIAPRLAASIAKDVADAISHAHSHGIIHRDIKPANILIDQSGSARVTDFGVCKTLNASANLTGMGEIVGTPNYMPPEQAGDQTVQAGPAADVYSIGAVLYALLTGHPPFQASNPLDVVTQVLTKEPVSPAQLNTSVPMELDIITLKCLRKSVRDRFATAQELSDDLQRYLNGEPIHAKPPSAIQRGRYFIRKHVIFASVSGTFAMLLVVLSAATGFALMRSQKQVAELQSLLQSERTLALKYAARASSEGFDRTNYEINRLSMAATRLKDTQPDVALQLAIFVATKASETRSQLPESIEQYLRSCVDSPEEAEALTIEEVVEKCQALVTTPLTEFERAVYGIVNPTSANPNAEDDQ